MSGRAALRSLPDRFRALPPRRRRLVVVASSVGYLVAFYALMYLVQTVTRDEPVGWATPLGAMVGPVIGSFLGGFLMAGWQVRRLGSSERLHQLEGALRTRRLPDDADPAVWGPLLAREQRFLRRAFTVLPVATVVLGAVVVGIVAVTAQDVQVGYLGIGAALIAAVVALLDWWGRRQQRWLADLVDQLPAGGEQAGR